MRAPLSRVTSHLQIYRATTCFPGRSAARGETLIHEIKHDGYRSQVVLGRGQARVFSRNGYDWTERYPFLVRAAMKLNCRSAIIDGEAIVQNGDGASDFETLGSALRQRPRSIILYAFDLLHLDGEDLRQHALSERRASLKNLIGDDAKTGFNSAMSLMVMVLRCSKPALRMNLRASSQTFTGTLSLWPKQDVAQDEMLHRVRLRGDWDRPEQN